MRQGLSMSLLALVVTLGGVVGVQLGRDAVGEIRPLFFSDLPDPPMTYEGPAAVPMQIGAAAMPSSVSWGYPYYLTGRPVCWGCPEKPETYGDSYYDLPNYALSNDLIPTSGRAVARKAPDDPGASIGDPAEPRPMERYAAFPVTQDEAQRMQHMADLQDGARSDEAQPVGM